MEHCGESAQHLFKKAELGDFFSNLPHEVFLHICIAGNLTSKALAALTSTCTLFGKSKLGGTNLTLTEIAAMRQCLKKCPAFLTSNELESVKEDRNVSWKRLLYYVEIMGRNTVNRMTATGYSFSLALAESGQVFTFGFYRCGALGLGRLTGNVYKPRLITSLAGIKIVQVGAGADHSILLGDTGEVFTMGQNANGSCGLGHNSVVTEPTRVVEFMTTPAVKVAAGRGFSAVVSKCGKLFTFGHKQYVGHGGSESQDTPREVDSMKGVTVETLAIGVFHTLVVAKSQSGRRVVFGYGDNSNWQLGFVSERPTEQFPKAIPSLQNLHIPVLSIAAGPTHSLLLLSNGIVKSWGHGGNSLRESRPACLGRHATDLQRAVPTNMEGLEGEFVICISAGKRVSYIVTDLGNNYHCGESQIARNGETPGTHDVPTLISQLKNVDVLHISSSIHQMPHTLMTTLQGHVLALGAAPHGQLGIPREEWPPHMAASQTFSPIPVKGLQLL